MKTTHAKTITRRLQVYTAAAVVALSSGMTTLIPQIVSAASEDIATVANKTAIINQPMTITDLSITGTGNDSVSVTVSAQHGTLGLGSTTGTTTSGTGTGTVAITGARDDVNAALATLSYTSASLGTDSVEVNLGSNVTGVIIDPVGGHAYKIIQANLTWEQARVAAKQLSYGGVQGYLANITSNTENQFIVDHLTGNGWIGGSDQVTEGDWKWMDGPEAGTSFWSGKGVDYGGQPALGPGDVPMYSHWNGNEPNDASSGEDCAEYIVGLGWNDLPCASGLVTRNYVVEFGAAEVPDPVTKSFTVTTTGPTKNIASCEELMSLDGDADRYDTINLTSDIDCTGVEAHPILGSENFYGTLNGNGHTIKNVTMSNNGNTHQALFAYSVDATFKDVTLDNFTIAGTSYVSALVADAYNTVTIDNVHVTNPHISSSDKSAGGLIGEGALEGQSLITNSSVDGGTIRCVADDDDCSRFGGLIGNAWIDLDTSLTIEQSYATIAIKGPTADGTHLNQAGGIIGYADIEQGTPNNIASLTLQDDYSWSTIDSHSGDDIGGLAGRVNVSSQFSGSPSYFTIKRSYSSGAVSGGNNIGGLVGMLNGDGNETTTLQNVFAMGTITAIAGEPNAGAIVGNGVTDTINASGIYFDQTRTTLGVASNNEAINSGATAVNTDGSQPHYFIASTTNSPLNTWDFEAVWVKHGSIPPTFGPYDETDTNGDGVPDNLQHNVASFISPVSSKRVVVELSDTCDITHASAAAESAVAGDAGYTYASGLIDFEADCTGESTQVTLYQYGVDVDGITARKFDPGTSRYTTVSSAAISMVTINGQQAVKAVYTIHDNDSLDLNKDTGTISDPIGLGKLTIGVPNTGLGGKG